MPLKGNFSKIQREQYNDANEIPEVQVSEPIRNRFCLARAVIGQENCGHFCNQSDTKLEPIVTPCQLCFPALDAALSLNSHWLLVVFPSILIGHCDLLQFFCRDCFFKHSMETRISLNTLQTDYCLGYNNEIISFSRISKMLKGAPNG